MKAREMFKELGYEYNTVKFKNEITRIEYIRDYEYSSNISFHLGNKSFNVWFGEDKQSGGITVDMLNAINKQIEELGWLENDNKE